MIRIVAVEFARDLLEHVLVAIKPSNTCAVCLHVDGLVVVAAPPPRGTMRLPTLSISPPRSERDEFFCIPADAGGGGPNPPFFFIPAKHREVHRSMCIPLGCKWVLEIFLLCLHDADACFSAGYIDRLHDGRTQFFQAA